MKKKPETLASQAKALRAQVALIDLRMDERFDKLANAQAEDSKRQAARINSLNSTAILAYAQVIEELRKQVSMNISALSLRIEIVERGHAAITQQPPDPQSAPRTPWRKFTKFLGF